MTFTEAAVEVLRRAGKPLHFKEIAELALKENLLSHVGQDPEVTMGQRLAAMASARKTARSSRSPRTAPSRWGDGTFRRRSTSSRSRRRRRRPTPASRSYARPGVI